MFKAQEAIFHLSSVPSQVLPGIDMADLFGRAMEEANRAKAQAEILRFEHLRCQGLARKLASKYTKDARTAIFRGLLAECSQVAQQEWRKVICPPLVILLDNALSD